MAVQIDLPQLLVDELYRRALKAEQEASRFTGTSSPSGFGPKNRAKALAEALDLAVKTLGVRPDPDITI